MNPDGSPAWQYLPPPAAPVVMVAPSPAAAPVQPMPMIPSSYQARLYPMNEKAAQTGQLVATITDLNTGRGLLTMTMGNEQLSGERAGRTHPGFGSVEKVSDAVPVRVSRRNRECHRHLRLGELRIRAREKRPRTGACLMSNGAAPDPLRQLIDATAVGERRLRAAFRATRQRRSVAFASMRRVNASKSATLGLASHRLQQRAADLSR
jgi:hypothetical protein